MSSSLDEPIFTAAETIAYRRANRTLAEFPTPHSVIFAPQKSLARHALRRHSARRIKGFLGEFYLFKRAPIALSTDFGIGAPAIAALTEEFIALGVKQFVLIGLAGSLQPELKPGSLVISTNTLRDEGVSRHYLPEGPSVDSSKELTQGLSSVLISHQHVHRLGPTWTTDVPYREIRKFVLEYQREGVLAVDMEAAALLAVARAMDASAAVAFSIADTVINGHWSMNADLRPAHSGLTVLFDAAFEYLK